MTYETFKSATLDSLRLNRAVIVVMGGYILFALILGRLAGFDVALQIYSERSTLVLFLVFGVAIVSVIVLQLYRHRPNSPIAFIRHLLMNDMKLVERTLLALPCMLLFPVFSSAFTSVKSAIGRLHPYGLDPLFAQWDRLLHGGHAWQLIHPLVGFPAVTFGLNFLYNLWLVIFLMMFALVTVMTGDRRLREQYLLSFVGCWIVLGSLAAIGLSSVGPCYYAQFYPGDPYAPLMSYLRSVNETYPLWALSTQDMLLERHLSEAPGLGSGISAMPSLHVAIATLNAILLSKLSRAAGIAGWIYMVAILIGSVHLGWHYAIDGYASIAGVLILWHAAGRWVARSPNPAPIVVAST